MCFPATKRIFTITDENNYCCLAESYSLIYDSDLDRAEQYAKQAMEMGSTSPQLFDALEAIEQGRIEFQPYQGKNHPKTKSGGGCYIATSVYGSYDCPEVWTLRRYRDYSLSKTLFGRLFIKVYYLLSPIMVSLFGKTKTLKEKTFTMMLKK